jgi:hypothetical protein
MRTDRILAAALAALTLSACAQTPATHADAAADRAGFVWGCWVAKEEPGGRILAFLRLLKDGPDGKFYEGHLHHVTGNDMTPALHLAVARDGSHATVTKADAAVTFRSGSTRDAVTSDGRRQIQFRSETPGAPGALVLAANEDRLLLTLQLGADVETFDGERDGCD